ncbi:hypothetical protein BC628DRAFT_77932 [Trametes gibbosa]|nr:hypothetical protein BC628DRAFT_77932 [Trametes gibbosa]
MTFRTNSPKTWVVGAGATSPNMPRQGKSYYPATGSATVFTLLAAIPPSPRIRPSDLTWWCVCVCCICISILLYRRGCRMSLGALPFRLRLGHQMPSARCRGGVSRRSERRKDARRQ